MTNPSFFSLLFPLFGIAVVSGGSILRIGAVPLPPQSDVCRSRRPFCGFRNGYQKRSAVLPFFRRNDPAQDPKN